MKRALIWVIAHVQTSHGTYVNESWHTGLNRVVSPCETCIDMSHGTCANESYHICEWDMPSAAVCCSVLQCVAVCCSVLQCKRVIPHMWMRHANLQDRPTQSIIYVPLHVNRFHKIILLIVQKEIFTILFQGFYSSESDPPHKIMQYWFYYSTQLGFWYPPDHAGLVEMICIGGVPLKKGLSAGPALKYFYMIHWVGRTAPKSFWVQFFHCCGV